MQGRQALTSANKEQLGGTRAPWPQGSIRRGCPRGSPSFEDPDPPALQEEMLSWLQGVSTAINESQSIRVKAQSLPLPPRTEALTVFRTSINSIPEDRGQLCDSVPVLCSEEPRETQQ